MLNMLNVKYRKLKKEIKMTKCTKCGKEIFESEKELEYFRERGFERRKKCRKCKYDEKMKQLYMHDTCAGIDF